MGKMGWFMQRKLLQSLELRFDENLDLDQVERIEATVRRRLRQDVEIPISAASMAEQKKAIQNLKV